MQFSFVNLNNKILIAKDLAIEVPSWLLYITAKKKAPRFLRERRGRGFSTLKDLLFRKSRVCFYFIDLLGVPVAVRSYHQA